MSQKPTPKPTPKKLEPLTVAIIADMKPGDERGGTQCRRFARPLPSLGEESLLLYRYRAPDNVLREIRLGEVGTLILVKARAAAMKKRLERDQGKDLQLEKRQNCCLRKLGNRQTALIFLKWGRATTQTGNRLPIR